MFNVKGLFRNFFFQGPHKSRKHPSHHFYPITEISENDIIIAGYPKSGNTWMQYIISAIVYELPPNRIPDRLVQELVPDVHYKKFYKRFLNRCFFKSHHLPEPKYRKVIHLVRHPMDAMISYYFYNINMGVKVTLEEMVINRRYIINSWREHTEQWLDNPYNSELLRIKYENLLTDPEKTIASISNFINFEISQEALAQIAQNSSFTKMKNSENRYPQENMEWNRNNSFYRRGSSDYDFPKHLHEFFRTEVKDLCDELGYVV